MNLPLWLRENLSLKLVALLLSLLVWGGVAAGRNGATTVVVPLKVTNLAPGLTLRGSVPAVVEVSIVGPRLLLYQLRREQLAVVLDFTGVSNGIVAFDYLGRGLDLNPGLEVIRTVPGRLQVWVEAAGNPVSH